MVTLMWELGSCRCKCLFWAAMRCHGMSAPEGEFEFESYYEPEKMECHPVMGGSAFLVRPDGIYLHRISNAQWEDVGLRTVTSETKIETSKPVLLSIGFLALMLSIQTTCQMNWMAQKIVF